MISVLNPLCLGFLVPAERNVMGPIVALYTGDGNATYFALRNNK